MEINTQIRPISELSSDKIYFCKHGAIIEFTNSGFNVLMLVKNNAVVNVVEAVQNGKNFKILPSQNFWDICTKYGLLGWYALDTVVTYGVRMLNMDEAQ